MAKLGIRLNLSNNGLSQITGWNFNSIAELEDRLLGCSNEGLFEFTGSTDNGQNINVLVSTPVSNCLIPHPKRIRKGYIEYETDGNLKITCTPGEGVGYTSILSMVSEGKEKANLFLGNRRYYGVNWQFTVENVDGADFSLDYLGILFISLTRSRSI